MTGWVTIVDTIIAILDKKILKPNVSNRALRVRVADPDYCWKLNPKLAGSAFKTKFRSLKGSQWWTRGSNWDPGGSRDQWL
jgi:hypothetical protein